MPLFRLCAVLLLALCVDQVARAGDEIRVQTADGNLLQFTQANPTDAVLTLHIAAGSLWAERDGSKFVVLREAEATLPAHAEAALQVPAAALAAQTLWKASQPLTPLAGAEPRLQPLLDYLATRNDVPRRTSQLATLALLEDVDLSTWQRFSSSLSAAVNPTDSADAAQTREVATALDAIAILQTVAPDQKFALVADPALKWRALHNPALRPKALQLYGMTIPGDAPAGGVVPSLGQLMHTAPGDNCPVCRMRQQMQPRDDAP